MSTYLFTVVHLPNATILSSLSLDDADMIVKFALKINAKPLLLLP